MYIGLAAAGLGGGEPDERADQRAGGRHAAGRALASHPGSAVRRSPSWAFRFRTGAET